METTANLQLPCIMPSQAQKHVTHNEALLMLDAIVQLSIRDRDLSAPPAGEGDGGRYIVAAGATGAWQGWDNAVALKMDEGWRRIEPHVGWIAWVEDEERLVRWTGAAWAALESTVSIVQNLALLGVGTTANAANPFAAKLNTALWTARYSGEGGNGDLRYTLNKQAPADTLSMLMQSNWSGRAEIGLIGNDDLTLKVSADGATWKEAIRIDRASGVPQFPQAASLDAIAGLAGAAGCFPRFTGTGPADAVMQAIVGSVSQSGGTPTGALVETGSNANGGFLRLAGGFQLCWGKSDPGIACDVANGTVFVSGSVPWSFPAGFASPPIVQASAVRTSTGTGWPWASVRGAIGTAGATFSAYAGSNNVQAQLQFIAVGPWHG